MSEPYTVNSPMGRLAVDVEQVVKTLGDIAESDILNRAERDIIARCQAELALMARSLSQTAAAREQSDALRGTGE